MAEPRYLLPVWDTISESWEKVKGAKAEIWKAYIILLLIVAGLYVLQWLIVQAAPDSKGLVSFLQQLISYPFQVALLYLGIKRAQDLPLNFRQMFRIFEDKIWLKLIGFYLLQMLIYVPLVVIIMIGTFFFAMGPDNTVNPYVAIIGGIIAGFIFLYILIRLYLAPGFIMDRNAGPIQSIKLSLQASRSNFWRMLAVFLILMIFIVISMIPLFIGLIWTIPLGVIVYGNMYKKLQANIIA